jgi:hypothetical protein
MGEMMTDTPIGPPSMDGAHVWLGLSLIPENVPPTLRNIDQWVLWKAEPRSGGGMDKVPYTVRGTKASSINTSTWSDWATVLTAYQEDGADYDGAGFNVKKENGILPLDFDHVRDAHSGVIDPAALEAIQRLNTYAEISPSGTGIRVIGFGSLERAITSPRLQGWVTGRYVTVTGQRLEGVPLDLAPIDPGVLADVIGLFAPKTTKHGTQGPSAAPRGDAGPAVGRGIPLTVGQCLEVRQALGCLNPDASYDQWLQIGMALHSTGASNAFELWDTWSATGPKYDARVCREKWASFTDRGSGIQLATLFKLAMDAGWINRGAATADLPPPISAEKPGENPDEKPGPVYRETLAFSESLLRQAPGILGDLLSWGVATAHKPQPHLALQAAIAVASTAMARRYRTRHNNWPVLWMLGIAVTASGKEHGKTMLEEALAAAGLEQRIGGSGYTSPGAIFSLLLDKPAHLSVIDEFGKLVESSQANGNQMKADAITQLMEAFGRAHAILRPPAYSHMTLTKEQREQFSKRKVCKPHLGLLAMTTPATFYDSLSRRFVSDGFLGRFLVCESPIGRMPSVYPDPIPVPEDIVEWLLEVGCEATTGGNLAAYEQAADLEPTPIILDFSPSARRSLAAFDNDILTRMDECEKYGLAELYGRTVEKAMRLALICCVAEGAGQRMIGDTPTQYAIDYVSACDDALVERAKFSIADTGFARIKGKCLELLRAAGPHGLTLRELVRKSAAFDGLKPREQTEVLTALNHSGQAQQQEVATSNPRGRKRVAWVALADTDDE